MVAGGGPRVVKRQLWSTMEGNHGLSSTDDDALASNDDDDALASNNDDDALASIYDEDAIAVDHFREFIRIPSMSGSGASGSYEACADFLSRFLNELAVPFVRLEPVSGKPILIATIRGTEPNLPCVLLNSHYDVVPVMAEHWKTDPFAAEMRDGYDEESPYVLPQHHDAGPTIVGRGTQDMKCIVIQYLHAIRRLKARGWVPRRTVHLTFVPDEEVGGSDGMVRLIESAEFAAMKPIGLVLDEGLANPRDGALTLFYGERTQWWLLIRATGPTGHGSRFVANTAVVKLMGVVQKALAFRREQEELLGWSPRLTADSRGGDAGGSSGGSSSELPAAAPPPAAEATGCAHCQAKKLGDVTTLNVTMLRTGVSLDGGKTFSLNVIPTLAEAGFDVRISPSLATADFKRRLNEWCAEDGLSWEFAPWVDTLEEHYVTSTAVADTPLYNILEDAVRAATGARVEREIFPAGTDSAFLRAMGVPAVGFSPLPGTPILLHEHNEALSVKTFLAGVRTYERIISDLAAAERQPAEEDQDQEAPAADRADRGANKRVRRG